MNGLTLKHLRYFEAVARLGHFGAAAEDCGISQPALSMQIKELELLLGAPLIERSTRKVRLSSLGEALAKRARVILNQVEELGELARAENDALSGKLRIGVIPTIAPYFLPSVIGTLSTHYPSLDLRPREAVTGRLIRDLTTGDLDLAILALPVSEPTLFETALFEESFVLVRPKSDKGKPVPDAEILRTMRLLLLEEGHCFRDQALSYCAPSPVSVREVMEGSSLSTLVQMVGANIGVTLIPEMAIATEAKSADVDVAKLGKPRPKRTVGMVWRKSSPLGERYKEIARLLGNIERC